MPKTTKEMLAEIKLLSGTHRNNQAAISRKKASEINNTSRVYKRSAPNKTAPALNRKTEKGKATLIDLQGTLFNLDSSRRKITRVIPDKASVPASDLILGDPAIGNTTELLVPTPSVYTLRTRSALSTVNPMNKNHPNWCRPYCRSYLVTNISPSLSSAKIISARFSILDQKDVRLTIGEREAV